MALGEILLGQPITARDLVHLVLSQSQPYNKLLLHLACINLIPAKRKKKLGHSCPSVARTYCKTNCCIVILLLVPLADNSFRTIWVPGSSYSPSTILNILSLNRGYYTVTRRYEFYVRVAKTISHSFAALTREILFLPREHKIHIFELTCNVLFII